MTYSLRGPVPDADTAAWFVEFHERLRKDEADYDAQHGVGAWMARRAVRDAEIAAETVARERTERGQALGEAWRSLPRARRSEAGLTFGSPKELGVLGEPLNSVHNLVIMGATGAGKTSLACAYMTRALLAAEETGEGFEIAKRMLFVSAFDLVRARAESRLGSGEPATLAAAKRASVLILDDVGAEPDDRDRLIADVVTSREANARRTIVTTWLTEAQVAERYGGNVHRRMFLGARVTLAHR